MTQKDQISYRPTAIIRDVSLPIQAVEHFTSLAAFPVVRQETTHLPHMIPYESQTKPQIADRSAVRCSKKCAYWSSSEL